MSLIEIEKQDLKWRWKHAHILKTKLAESLIILKEQEIKDLKEALKTGDFSKTDLDMKY